MNARSRCALFALGLLVLVPRLVVAQIDGSSTITTGGVAQAVFSGRQGRTFLFCQNPIGASETLFVNAPTVAGATNGSFELAAGGSLTFNGTFTPQGPVSVYAATTAHRFICKEG